MPLNAFFWRKKSFFYAKYSHCFFPHRKNKQNTHAHARAHTHCANVPWNLWNFSLNSGAEHELERWRTFFLRTCWRFLRISYTLISRCSVVHTPPMLVYINTNFAAALENWWRGWWVFVWCKFISPQHFMPLFRSLSCLFFLLSALFWFQLLFFSLSAFRFQFDIHVRCYFWLLVFNSILYVYILFCRSVV